MIKNEVREIGPIRLEVCPVIKSQVTFSDFCAPIASMEFKAYAGFLKNSTILFSYTYDQFILEAKVRDGMIFIMRNGLYQHSEQYLGDDTCLVALQWNIDSIGCGVLPPNSKDDMNKHFHAVQTPITVPPQEIITLLRNQSLLSNTRHHNLDGLFGSVIDSIYLAEQDIRRHGAERLIWQKSNDKSFQPSNEPEISRFVASFLSVYGSLRNFDVVCESIAGTGNLDIYVIAPLETGIGKIAIEAKKAESDDLVHGLETQLPVYMQRIGTSHGIYLVYWLKSPSYPYPTKHNSFAELELEKLHPIKRLNTMRTFGINLAKEDPPSRQ